MTFPAFSAPSLALCLLAFGNFEPTLIPILVPVAAFLFILSLLVIIMFSNAHKGMLCLGPRGRMGSLGVRAVRAGLRRTICWPDSSGHPALDHFGGGFPKWTAWEE